MSPLVFYFLLPISVDVILTSSMVELNPHYIGLSFP